MYLLFALKKLRDEISRIEAQYPSLNNGLVALCDEAIQSIQSKYPPEDVEDHLISGHCIERSDKEIPHFPNRTDDCPAPSSMPADTKQFEEELTPIYDREERCNEAIYDSSAKADAYYTPLPTIKKANPIVSALDHTGHYLALGLDKAGDGIIFVFEGLLKLGGRSNGK